jgi:hypothetical protein
MQGECLPEPWVQGQSDYDGLFPFFGIIRNPTLRGLREWQNEPLRGGSVTFEKKTVISPADIIAIHYMCTKCGSSQAVPISLQHSVPNNCASCGEHWFSFGDPRQNDLFRMVEYIRAGTARVAEFPNTEVTLQVKLEIACGNSN